MKKYKNIFRFFTYVFLITLYLFFKLVFIDHIFNAADYRFSMCFGIIKACFILWGIYIAINWVNNWVYFSYLKKQGYDISVIHLYPILFVKDNNKKWKISLSMYSLIHIQSEVFVSDVERYIQVHKRLIQILKMIHILVILGCVTLSIPFHAYGICVLAAVLSLLCLYGMEGGTHMLEGLYKMDCDSRCAYRLFVCYSSLEQCGQEYRKLQNKYLPFGTDYISETCFLTNLLISSIYDNRDYVESELYNKISNKYLQCDDGMFSAYIYTEPRLMNALMLYMSKFHEIKIGTRYKWKYFYEEHMKMFEKCFYPEQFTPLKGIDAYENKVNKVYSEMREYAKEIS